MVLCPNKQSRQTKEIFEVSCFVFKGKVEIVWKDENF